MFMDIFEVKVGNFALWQWEKNTGNYVPEMTSKWERMRTAVSDLPSARLGFCLKKSIFVSKNCSELFRNIQKFRHYEEKTA